MIVVDTNIIVYLCLSGEHTLEAEKVFEKDPDWVAPRLWRSEFLNVLSVYLRRGDMTVRESSQIVERAEAIMKNGNYEVAVTEVLELASRSGASGYDCEFIALAKNLKIPLVTLDKALLKAAPSNAISPKDFLEFNKVM